MMVHKMLDAIRSPHPGLFIIPKGDELFEITAKIQAAEKFDFGDLMLELSGTDPIPRYSVTKLTDEEHDFIDQGLVPLPSRLSWFECRIAGYTTGLLVEANSEWRVTRLDYERHQGTGAIDGVWTTAEINYDKAKAEKNGRYSFKITGDKDYLQKCYGYDAEVAFEAVSQLGRSMSHGSNWYLARYLNFMINSRSSKHIKVPGAAPNTFPREGKAQPKPAHTIVTIVPREYFVYARAEGEAVRASPRLHWRRSHIRTLSDGRKLVIPRFLVGRADLGTISHEYRVPA